MVFHGRTEGYLRSAYCTWPGVLVHGQQCAAVGQSGGSGDQEMRLEGAEVEMSGAGRSRWLMEIGCRSQTVALVNMNTEILPYFAHCHLGLVGTCASGLYTELPPLLDWSRPAVGGWPNGRSASCDAASLPVAFVWPFLETHC